MKYIFFDDKHRERGVNAIIRAGTVVWTKDPGVYAVPDKTVAVLKKKRIPFRFPKTVPYEHGELPKDRRNKYVTAEEWSVMLRTFRRFVYQQIEAGNFNIEKEFRRKTRRVFRDILRANPVGSTAILRWMREQKGLKR